MAARSVTVCGQRLDGSPHICAFFDSREHEYDVLIPYYREGIDCGDRVVAVVDADARADHIARLEAAGIPVERAQANQQLQLLTPEETYLRTGRFDVEEMFAAVGGMLASAKSEGASLRTCAEMHWLAESDTPAEEVMEYESRVNVFTRDHDCAFMCIYDLSLLSGALVADIIATHPFVILNQRVRDNPHFIDPDTYVNELLRPRQRARAGARPSRPH